MPRRKKLPDNEVELIRLKYKIMKKRGRRHIVKIISRDHVIPIDTAKDYIYYRSREPMPEIQSKTLFPKLWQEINN